MPNKQLIIQLLNNLSDYKAGYVLAYIQGIMADEQADDAYCEQLYNDYLNDPDPEKDKLYTLEECKKEWGI